MRRKLITLAATVLATLAIVGPVSAMPSVDLSGSYCSVVKNQNGTYTSTIHASAYVKEVWQINRIQIWATTNGNTQELNFYSSNGTVTGFKKGGTVPSGAIWYGSSTSVASIPPTPAVDFMFSWGPIREYAKKLYLNVYNGSTLKGQVAVTCQNKNF